MTNIISKLFNGKDPKKKEVTLDDVTPLHPNDYPAKHLKEKLDARHDRMQETEEGTLGSGMPEGPGN